MPRILIIADDLTGAAELAGIAKLGGLSVKMAIASSDLLLDEGTEDVIVMDTNTRNCSPQEARQILEKVFVHLDPFKYDLIYKKTDSVLRGPVATELSTLMKLTGITNTLLIPANPNNSRTIREGKYYINDIPISETSFKNDPFYPRQRAEVEELIIDNQGRVTYSENPVPELAKTSGKIIIGPVSSVQELKMLTQKVIDKKILFAGGADFFRQLLQMKFHLEFESYALPATYHENPAKKIFIWGSHPENWEKHLVKFENEHFSFEHMHPGLVKKHGEKGLWNKWMEKVWKQVNANPRIVITGPVPSFIEAEDLNMITSNLSKVAKQLLLYLESPAEIYVEGGETAFTLIQMLNWKEMRVSRVLAYGVVAVKSPDSEHEIIIKPGSYAWP